jgi:hypothetical protein
MRKILLWSCLILASAARSSVRRCTNGLIHIRPIMTTIDLTIDPATENVLCSAPKNPVIAFVRGALEQGVVFYP